VSCTAAAAQYTTSACADAAGSLPFTGYALGHVLATGFVIVLLGAALVVASIRRGH